MATYKPRNGRFANEQAIREELRRIGQQVGTIAELQFEIYGKPVETPDGVITDFTTTRIFEPGSLALYLNGVQQQPQDEDGPNNFHEAISLKGFTVEAAIRTGANVVLHYRYR